MGGSAARGSVVCTNASDTLPCAYRRMTGHFSKITCVSFE